jgi:hypothetical protein
MGLDIGVGWLAEAARDSDDLEAFNKTFELLNEVLAEAGMPPHREPLDITNEQMFSAQMWGYGGLHAIRRLAAFYACEGYLPPPGRLESYSNDPMIERLYQYQQRHFLGRSGNFLKRWLSPGKTPPKFQHLFWHSDCEGFYLPEDFEQVILDKADPQRTGIGGMVGSSPRLLKECLELAQLISLPPGMDPEAEELWMSADDPPAEGKLWQVYGVEAFGLARLIRGCELSIKNQAVLAFG